MPRLRSRTVPRYYAIPVNLDIRELVTNRPGDSLQRRALSPERFARILDGFYRAARRAKVRSDDAFVPVPSRFWHSIASDYSAYLTRLEDRGVLEVDHKYHAGSGGRCKRYRMASHYRTRLQFIRANSGSIVSTAPDQIADDAPNSTMSSVLPARLSPFEAPRFIGFFDSLCAHYVTDSRVSNAQHPTNQTVIDELIDVFSRVSFRKGAIDRVYAEAQSIIAANSAVVFLLDIRSRQGRFTLSKKTGRLYSPVTQMPRTARRELTIDGSDDLATIDVRACQPYLMICVARLVKQEAPWLLSDGELDEWRELVLNDDIYTRCATAMRELFAVEQARGHWKVTLQRIFNGRAGQFRKIDGSQFREKHMFYAAFPGIAAVVDWVKSNPSPNSARLSLLLQRLESDVMLWRVCPQLLRGGIPVLTVHDAVIVPAEHAEYAARVIETEFEQLVGPRPQLDIKFNLR